MLSNWNLHTDHSWWGVGGNVSILRLEHTTTGLKVLLTELTEHQNLSTETFYPEFMLYVSLSNISAQTEVENCQNLIPVLYFHTHQLRYLSIQWSQLALRTTGNRKERMQSFPWQRVLTHSSACVAYGWLPGQSYARDGMVREVSDYEEANQIGHSCALQSTSRCSLEMHQILEGRG